MYDSAAIDLFRPVGLYELVAIIEAGYRAYPPRLPEQPIFYPVLNYAYASEIASRWNPDDPNSGFAGFVTAFRIPSAVARRWPRKVVGGRRHEELWVPSDEQSMLEAEIIAPIEVTAAWAGERLAQVLPSWTGPTGELADAQRQALVALVATGPVLGGPATLAHAHGRR